MAHENDDDDDEPGSKYKGIFYKDFQENDFQLALLLSHYVHKKYILKVDISTF